MLILIKMWCSIASQKLTPIATRRVIKPKYKECIVNEHIIQTKNFIGTYEINNLKLKICLLLHIYFCFFLIIQLTYNGSTFLF